MARITWYRKISQLAFFVVTGQWLMMGFLRCPFGVPFVSCATCPLGDCTGRFLFFPVVVLLLGSAVLLGRAFCGWVCPLGTLEDAAGCIATSAPLKHSPLGHLARHDRWFRFLKVVVLAAVVWVFLTCDSGAGRPHPYVVRSPELWNLDAFRLGGALGLARYPIRAAVLLAALLGALLVPRLWCRWFCPLGVLLGLFNRFSPFRLRRDMSSCCSCGRFPEECVQHTLPGSTECIVCGECVAACPKHAITMRPSAREEVSPAGTVVS